MAKNTIRRNNLRQHGMLIDFINIILCILIIASAIFLALNVEKHMIIFPLIFLLSAIMNGCLGVKKYKMDEYSACIILFFVALLLLALSIFSFIVII